MKFVSKLIVILLFILLFLFFFSFALKNTQQVSLHILLSYELRGPLVLLLLGFFLGGTILGILVMTPTVFNYRRELNKSRQTVQNMQQSSKPTLTQPEMLGL